MTTHIAQGLITTLRDHNNCIETLHNVFSSELKRLGGGGATPLIPNSYRGLTNLLKGMTIQSRKRMVIVTGSVRFNRSASSLAMSGGSSTDFRSMVVPSNLLVSASATYPVISDRLYYNFSGVNYPVFVLAHNPCTVGAGSTANNIQSNYGANGDASFFYATQCVNAGTSTEEVRYWGDIQPNSASYSASPPFFYNYTRGDVVDGSDVGWAGTSLRFYHNTIPRSWWARGRSGTWYINLLNASEPAVFTGFCLLPS